MWIVADGFAACVRFVVQERGVGRAAGALHLSQPAVSQALKRLEEAVGGLLLYRRHGEFRLTGLGEEIYRLAREMYGMVARIDEAAATDFDKTFAPKEKCEGLPSQLLFLKHVSMRKPRK